MTLVQIPPHTHHRRPPHVCVELVQQDREEELLQPLQGRGLRRLRRQGLERVSE